MDLITIIIKETPKNVIITTRLTIVEAAIIIGYSIATTIINLTIINYFIYSSNISFALNCQSNPKCPTRRRVY
jgi:hypothetical protein